MRRIAVGLAVAAAALVPMVGSGPVRAAATVNLTISNFRYCSRAAPVCLPTDQAYTRTASGPTAGSDTPSAFVAVHPGDTVVWTYEDNVCSAFQGGCSGHEVRLDDGSQVPPAPAVGTATYTPLGQTITYQVPATAAPGTLIRYYCNINNHWQFGMTGILQVG